MRSDEELIVRHLAPENLPEAGMVLDSAFRRSGMLAALQFTYDLDPAHWYAAWQKGALIATAGAYRYASAASIGMVAVSPPSQGRGVANKLLSHLLAALEAAGCRDFFLDATAEGARLYPRFGFAATTETLRMHRDRSAKAQEATPVEQAAVEILAAKDLPAVTAYDAAVFGRARPEVIAACSRRKGPAYVAWGPDGEIAGYLLASESRIGPWMARQPATAEALLRAALAQSGETPLQVTLPAAGGAGESLLARCGFYVSERLQHMVRGADDPRRLAEYYGLPNLSLG